MVLKWWGDMGKCVPVQNGMRWSRVLATPRMFYYVKFLLRSILVTKTQLEGTSPQVDNIFYDKVE